MSDTMTAPVTAYAADTVTIGDADDSLLLTVEELTAAHDRGTVPSGRTRPARRTAAATTARTAT